uniref:hypothetical protein n=1 Tax=Ningiella ruwaisensis TaxID=2364274 RepID=UPI0015D15F63|nr:hypothetical protein [Ningiella ruwaisensis]
MGVSIFTDNDVILKLARYDLLSSLVNIVKQANYEFKYLDALPYVAGLDTPKQAAKMGLNSVSLYSIRRFIEQSSPVNLSDEGVFNFIQQQGNAHLDAGELILTISASENSNSGLFTGDKRALRAIDTLVKNKILNFSSVEVLVLEEAVRMLMHCSDRKTVVSKIRSTPGVDTALDVCFCNESCVDEAIDSYINDAASSCRSLVFAYKKHCNVIK